jgi:hypothetical protein
VFPPPISIASGEPFFRPELARTREGGGVGLGLAIVRKQHRGLRRRGALLESHPAWIPRRAQAVRGLKVGRASARLMSLSKARRRAEAPPYRLNLRLTKNRRRHIRR